MRTNNKKYGMTTLISTLADGWRGTIASISGYAISWITAEATFTAVSHITMLITLSVAVLTLIGQVQKQVDRYKAKHKAKQ